jgi:hypothetical protein
MAVLPEPNSTGPSAANKNGGLKAAEIRKTVCSKRPALRYKEATKSTTSVTSTTNTILSRRCDGLRLLKAINHSHAKNFYRDLLTVVEMGD